MARLINGLLSSGQAIPATVSQSQLRELQALQAKADKFRARLEAAVRAGARVEPGCPGTSGPGPADRLRRGRPASSVGPLKAA